MSINTTVAICLHNFPEGLATFVATLSDPGVGVVLAIAIAIHNIPKGLCVAITSLLCYWKSLEGLLLGSPFWNR